MSEVNATTAAPATLETPFPDGAVLPRDKSVALDLAYDEYCRRIEAGEAIDPDEFCGRFSRFQSSLYRLLEAHRLFDENPDLLDGFDDVHWPEENDVFLDLHLIRLLGRGAFARVFLARQPEMGDRLVVVKIALRGGGEAKTQGRLEHENIVRLYSIQQEPASGLTAVCMPYLGRATLCDVLDAVNARPALPTDSGVLWQAIEDSAGDIPPAGRRPVPAALRAHTYADAIVEVSLQIAEALAFIHAEGVCHRDLKPSNILMTPDGRPMLLDFNLAAQKDRGADRIGGTLPYMAPEQLTALEAPGGAPCAPDAAADVFAFGVILHELLTGAHPFGPIPLNSPSKEVCGQLLRRQRGGAAPLREANPQVDVRLADLVARCLAFEAKRRPQDGAELLEALRPLARRRPEQAQRRGLRGWIGRHARSVAAALLLVVGASALLLGARSSTRDLERGREAFRLGRFEEAVQLLGRALEADPDVSVARVERAKALQRLGRFDQAYDEFGKLPDAERDGPIEACLGYCADRRGRHDVAIRHYETALKLGFGPAWLYNNLGFGRLRRGLPESAQPVLDHALQLEPRLQAASINRARLDLARAGLDGKYLPAQGIEDISRAVEIGPLTGELFYDAATIYALAARHDASWLGPGVDAVEKAVRFGASVETLKNDPVLRFLRDDAGFAPALAQAPERPYEKAVVLIDPLSAPD